MTLLATGEMGIGNTTTSSAVAAALLNCETAAITGKVQDSVTRDYYIRLR